MTQNAGILLRKDLEQLRNELIRLQKKVDISIQRQDEQFDVQEKKWQKLEKNVADLFTSAHHTDADLSSQLDQMLRDVQELRGTVELTEHRMGQTENKLEQTIQKNIQAIENTETNPSEPNKSQNNNQHLGLPLDKTNKQDALNYALKLYKNNQNSEAKATFKDILALWPEDLGIADQALFYSAEINYNDKNYQKALQQYIRIVSQFSKSNIIDKAYYKIALCSIALDRLEDAQTFLHEVVNHHSQSSIYKAAKQKLEEINQKISNNNAKSKKNTQSSKKR